MIYKVVYKIQKLKDNHEQQKKSQEPVKEILEGDGLRQIRMPHKKRSSL